MKKVWLATTYYMDPKLAGCNAAVERMFTRLIAYAGNAETRGFLPENVHKLVGIPSGKSSVFELVSRGILTEIDGGGFRFQAWSDWNGEGDKLLERQQRDRDRKRRKRAETRETSADTSAEIHPPEERREEKRSTYVDPSPSPSGQGTADEDGFEYESTLTDLAAAPARPKAKAEPVREDVEHLCELLRDRILDNGNRAPATIPDSWRKAARLLLDRDGVTVDQARAVIHWCQSDDFWHANILSMPTLRKQYPKLEAKARAAYRAPARPSPTVPARTSQQAQRDALDEILGLDGFDDLDDGPHQLATVHPIIQGELTA